MRSTIILFSSVLFAFLAFPAAAQHITHHPELGKAMMSDSTTGMMHGSGMIIRRGMMGSRGMMGKCPMDGQGMMQRGIMGNMMQGGMRGNMMQGIHDGNGMMFDSSPMRKKMMLINRLPEMKTSLSLTDDQVEKLQQMQNDFRKNRIDQRALLAKKRIDLDAAIEKSASVSDIRDILKEMSDTQITMAVNTYETAGKMNDVLNPGQKEKLKNQMMGNNMMPGMIR